MEQRSSLSRLDDFDLEDLDYPGPKSKDACTCGRPKQRRSTTCRPCFLGSLKGNPKWKGSEAWKKEQVDDDTSTSVY